jgi:penicillin-binding protein 1A
LAQSINTIAVRLMMDVGPDKVVTLAKRLGMEATLRPEPSLALGTSEVSLLDLTGAYGAFASGGTAVEPHVIRRIRSSTGRVLYARPAPSGDTVAAPGSVAALNGMLQTVVESGTGKRAGLAAHATAGKTGTSQDFRDAWFIGYTAHYVGGVWTGNDNGSPMRKATGGNLPAVIWNRVMDHAHAGLESLPLAGTQTVSDAQGYYASDRTVAPELLPWRMPTTLAPAPAAKPEKPAGKRADPVVHPKTRIDEDFIARALQGLPNAAGPEWAETVAPVPPQAAPRPLSGLMSLGVGAGTP